MMEDEELHKGGAVVALSEGMTAEDVRRFFQEFRYLCHDRCGGHGLPTVVYLGGQANIYCRRSCAQPVATVASGYVDFWDPDALALGVVQHFQEYQRSLDHR